MFILVSSFSLSPHQQSAQMLFCPHTAGAFLDEQLKLDWAVLHLYLISDLLSLPLLLSDWFCMLYGCLMIYLFIYFPSAAILVLFHDLFCVALYSRSAETKRLGQGTLLHALPGSSFIPGNLFYWSHLSLCSCLMLSTYPAAWIAINMNYTTW